MKSEKGVGSIGARSERGAYARRDSVQTLLVSMECGGVLGLLPARVV
ncbi:MAG: hypothetical protein K9N47_23965 [Prosthecobacter sp.]|nr:hypothetical protein [Prosthecobacter sp.]